MIKYVQFNDFSIYDCISHCKIKTYIYLLIINFVLVVRNQEREERYEQDSSSFLVRQIKCILFFYYWFCTFLVTLFDDFFFSWCKYIYIMLFRFKYIQATSFRIHMYVYPNLSYSCLYFVVSHILMIKFYLTRNIRNIHRSKKKKTKSSYVISRLYRVFFFVILKSFPIRKTCCSCLLFFFFFLIYL